jgi:hypothetical protein
MGCCVVAIALISQFFALWHKLRRALGLPVREWYDDGPLPTAAMIWRARLRTLTSTTIGRSILAAVVVAELVFLGVALPGPHGLIARHRQHIREAFELVAKYGEWPGSQALFCRSPRAAAPASAPQPPL